MFCEAGSSRDGTGSACCGLKHLWQVKQRLHGTAYRKQRQSTFLVSIDKKVMCGPIDTKKVNEGLQKVEKHMCFATSHFTFLVSIGPRLTFFGIGRCSNYLFISKKVFRLPSNTKKVNCETRPRPQPSKETAEWLASKQAQRWYYDYRKNTHPFRSTPPF